MTSSTRSPRAARRAAVLLVSAGALLNLTGCALFSPQPSFQAPAISAADVGLPGASTPSQTPAAPSGSTETSVFDLEIGQCLDGTTDGATIEVVDCSEPHEHEVYALPEIEGESEYPGDAVTEGMADELCGGDAFTDYVGRTYLSSQYFYQELWPSEESWADGDRQVVCMLDTAGETGSLRGVNR